MPLIWDDEDLVRFVPPADPGEWIDLKRELSSGDDDKAWDALMATDASVQGGMEDVRVAFRVTALNRERVRRSIVAWSYRHNGEPVPVTPENIDRLDRKTYSELIEKVDELNPFDLPKLASGAPRNSATTSRASRRARRRT